MKYQNVLRSQNQIPLINMHIALILRLTLLINIKPMIEKKLEELLSGLKKFKVETSLVLRIIIYI